MTERTWYVCTIDEHAESQFEPYGTRRPSKRVLALYDDGAWSLWRTDDEGDMQMVESGPRWVEATEAWFPQ